MQTISLDRDHPEVWTLGPAVAALGRGDLVVLPTDTIYALACDPWDRQAVNQLYAAKGMAKTKRCAVLCGHLKEVGAVARAVSDDAFRFMRTHLPGAYTVLLHASWELPKQASGRRKTIGIRMPNDEVSSALVEQFGRPILVTSLPGWVEGEPLDPVHVSETLLRKRPAVVIDRGPMDVEPSTVVDFTVEPPELVRQGKGEVDIGDF